MKGIEKKNVLFIPSIQKGNGTGHFRRCLAFSNSDIIDGKLYIPDNTNDDEYSLFELKTSIPGLTGFMTVSRIEGEWDLIILDQRNTPSAILDMLPSETPVIALDEGSRDDRMDYLVDLLPVPGREKPNIFQPLLGIDPDIPVRNPQRKQTGKILITFGGEDYAGLTSSVLDFFQNTCRVNDLDITAVEGPLFHKSIDDSSIRVLKNPQNLSGCLSMYDLVITSFGVTSYEAVRAGVPVIHVNPSSYHTKLSRHANFPVGGTKGVNASRMNKFIEDVFAGLLHGPWEQKDECTVYFPEYVAELSLKKTKCPCCAGSERKSLERFSERTFFLCRSCGTVYQSRAFDHDIEYRGEYYFDDYKKQYGKTYLQDFEHIKELGKQRIHRIQRFTGRQSAPKLLDVGCAYGPFLRAASETGYICTGIDISNEAVEYVHSELNIPAYVSDFPHDLPPALEGESFSVITMWYVIEHFEDINSVLKTVSGLCTPRGMFCFSTPNFSGISSRKNRRKFLSRSPQDHTVVFSPSSVRRVLRDHGFTSVKCVATGIHRERMPSWLTWLPGPLLEGIGRAFLLGDTFEIYAIKKG